MQKLVIVQNVVPYPTDDLTLIGVGSANYDASAVQITTADGEQYLIPWNNIMRVQVLGVIEAPEVNRMRREGKTLADMAREMLTTAPELQAFRKVS